MSMKKIAITILLAALCALGACSRPSDLPTKSSPQYNELVRTFYIGLAALQVGHDVQADAKLAQFTQLAPSEPAGWANWGLLALRQRNYDQSAERLRKADRKSTRLNSSHSQISYAVFCLKKKNGRVMQSIP